MLRLSDKTRVPDIKPDKPFAGVSSTNRPNGKVQASQQIKQKEQGFISESFGTTQNTILGGIPQYLDMDPLLTGMTWTTKDSDLVTLYRDMYYFDSIAGSCVDLYSNLPFSDFALGGIKDSRVMDKFLEALERINAYVLFPEISVDYQVTGTYLSTLLYNKKEKRFVDLMAHSIENAEITELPFYSQDPIINMKFPDRVRQCFSSDSKRITALKQRLGPNVVELLSKSELELDPLSTIYIPRRTFSTSSLGTSYFRRILPIYLIEKNLYRGTLIESGRRQRGILHLSVGDGDQWEPTPTDLEFITDLFLNADADPIGSIVATRLGIDINEFRAGGDFWRVTEVWDTTLPYKLRALGISENFLSGEASYATLESNLTIFVETLRAYRDMMTRKFFYNKLFPLISLVNGYSVNSKGKVIQSDSMLRGDVEDILGTIQDGNKLLIPTVHWAKQLKPEGDQSYIDMLGLLTEKGVPVPLRAFAAAGGFNMDELLQQQEEDLELNKRVLQYQKSLAELKKEHGPAVDEESLSSGYDPSRAYTEKEQKILKLLSPTVGTQSRSSVQATGGKPSILNRDFGEHSEVYKTSKTGKKQHVFFQARANSKANDMIMKSMNTIAKNKHTPLSHTTMTDIKSNEHERKLLKKRGLT